MACTDSSMANSGTPVSSVDSAPAGTVTRQAATDTVTFTTNDSASVNASGGVLVGTIFGKPKQIVVAVTAIAVAVVAITVIVLVAGLTAIHKKTSAAAAKDCPTVTNYEALAGRLNVYFETFSLEAVTVDQGSQLTSQVISRYNGFFGCDSVFSRLMLNATALSCKDETCCEVV
jgi:hypothetical protein